MQSRSIGFWSHLVSLFFAQLSQALSLYDIADTLNSHIGAALSANVDETTGVRKFIVTRSSIGDGLRNDGRRNPPETFRHRESDVGHLMASLALRVPPQKRRDMLLGLLYNREHESENQCQRDGVLSASVREL